MQRQNGGQIQIFQAESAGADPAGLKTIGTGFDRNCTGKNADPAAFQLQNGPAALLLWRHDSERQLQIPKRQWARYAFDSHRAAFQGAEAGRELQMVAAGDTFNFSACVRVMLRASTS